MANHCIIFLVAKPLFNLKNEFLSDLSTVLYCLSCYSLINPSINIYLEVITVLKDNFTVKAFNLVSRGQQTEINLSYMV